MDTLDVEVREGRATVHFPGIAGNFAVYIRNGHGGVIATTEPLRGIPSGDLRTARRLAHDALYKQEA